MDDKLIHCSMCNARYVFHMHSPQASWYALRFVGSMSFGNTTLELRDCKDPCKNTLGRMTTRKENE